MLTKKQIIAALSDLKDDDEVIIRLLTPEDDDDDAGFSETDSVEQKGDEDEEEPNFVDCEADEMEVVDAIDDSGAKALAIYVSLPGDEDDDTIFVDEDGHYVDSEDNYVTKDGEPSATPVKADPSDIEDA